MDLTSSPNHLALHSLPLCSELPYPNHSLTMTWQPSQTISDSNLSLRLSFEQDLVTQLPQATSTLEIKGYCKTLKSEHYLTDPNFHISLSKILSTRSSCQLFRSHNEQFLLPSYTISKYNIQIITSSFHIDLKNIWHTHKDTSHLTSKC